MEFKQNNANAMKNEKKEIPAKKPQAEDISKTAPKFTSPEEKIACENLAKNGLDGALGEKPSHLSRWTWEDAAYFALKKGFYGEFLEQVVEIAKNDKGNHRNWSHSLCHFFEQPGNGTHIYDAGRQDLVEDLLRFMALKAIVNNELGCAQRTIDGLIEYNLMNLGRLDSPLAQPFPEIMYGDEFLEILDREMKGHGPGGDAYRKIFSSKTQKELLLAALDIMPMSISLRWSKTALPKVLASLGALEGELGAEKTEAYFRELVSDCNIGLNAAIENMGREKAAKELPGIYVDVDGTLVVDGKLNVELVRELEGRIRDGETVKIVTGGDPEEKGRLLKGLFAECGLEGSKISLEVGSKGLLKGKTLEYLYDDTCPEAQGFGSKAWNNLKGHVRRNWEDLFE